MIYDCALPIASLDLIYCIYKLNQVIYYAIYYSIVYAIVLKLFVNVTSIGRRYLGSFIGSDQGKEAFIEDKVQEWCRDLKQLSDIASREPQIAYSAYVYGLSKRWNYVCRTTTGVADRLTPRLD